MNHNIAVITARGGSKRIPMKNIKDFCGKPIIAYSIQSAIDSGCFEEIMVSTDDKNIAEIATRYGASVPFFRSSSSSNDLATTSDVIEEVLNDYHKLGIHPDFICCIYPTAPFITPSRLKEGLSVLLTTKASGVIPITRFSYPIQRALRLSGETVSFFQPEHMLTRSQDLEPAFHDAGQFYWLRASAFIKTPSLIGPDTVGILLPPSEVQDIDNPEDWEIAEVKYRSIKRIRMSPGP